ncbi:hypothetical protein M405DRAFT_192570 [Rhizopogon salebrosus TDB-379]|nr:hypothetical protein M405DRAFT_192570 [Rhizopogon salebrosus TDB-379]
MLTFLATIISLIPLWAVLTSGCAPPCPEDWCLCGMASVVDGSRLRRRVEGTLEAKVRRWHEETRQVFFIQTLLTCFLFCVTGPHTRPAHQAAILAVVLSGRRPLSSYCLAAWMDVSPSLSFAHIHAQPRMCTNDHSSKNTPAMQPLRYVITLYHFSISLAMPNAPTHS